MSVSVSIRKFVVSAVVPMTLLSSCTYDYDQFNHDTKSLTNGGSSIGGASVRPGQGGTTADEGTGGTSAVGSDAGQSSTGGSEGNELGGSTNGPSTGGTAPVSSTIGSSGGDPNAGGNGGTSEVQTGGTSSADGTGGTTQISTTGGQAPTGGSGSVPLTCGTSQTPCGTVCADLSNDASHCGQCNINCTTSGLSFGCYAGICGCVLPANCGSGSGVDCVNHQCACSGTTCSAGQVCQKHGNTRNCAAP